ncbi:MAG: MarR family winged helix-turn-helix transcriptional regulator [Candidatus Bathyarchaeota archaeon]|jgi:DNA-binding MarR family transcriptional regulator|nr:MarR family winged helix-turn-helix transcriptional regulator [Candidatus Bathyarchaeota archaeon]MDI9578970.1 MarR family winged helix-turn-helix transcriptional regulator [Thermoproteota archaeon]NLD65561.1 winged helix-turn-helix transcriptional regulator [Thermoproteota archaeon]
MKTSSGAYAFSKAELQTLREIARGNYELSSIQAKLSIKPPLLTYTLKKLQSKGLIKLDNNGVKKQVYLSDAKHAILLRNLLTIYDHVDWENLLKDKAIKILFQVLTGPDKLTGVPRNTLWRYMKVFKARGIITHEGKVNSQFRGLPEFLEEYHSFFAKKIANELSDNSVILWQRNMQLLIRTAKSSKPSNRYFHKTATSIFPMYNLPLFSEFDVYFYSTTKQTIKPEDAILHTLLIEPSNVRYSTYALLLLKKTEKQIDKTYLIREAEHLGLEHQVTGMLDFLQTHMRPEGHSLPTWVDFVEKARDYGVMV